MAMVVVVVVVGVIRWLLRALRFPTWVGVIGTLCESSRLRRAAFRPRMLSEKAATGSFTMACWKTKLMLLLRICSTTGAVLFSLFTLISIFKNLVSVNKILYFEFDRGQAEKEFKVEVETIGRVRHKNLVRLLGYCAEGAHRYLFFFFMPS